VFGGGPVGIPNARTRTVYPSIKVTAHFGLAAKLKEKRETIVILL
jgi:hypothetical protein